ncbi:hypothetical protein GALMADRAFT_592730 [Galerina marginata CBS 339.88]|uniref:Secreted protein n=1 Tax=Galerina marginata (strain CBS 339.88) TaxID=685588 RepID=A0A067SUW7_GALM3|nr:hypothetical protein GALMADRAFT_592730 [Galerina marginata CBS 339.88]
MTISRCFSVIVFVLVSLPQNDSAILSNRNPFRPSIPSYARTRQRDENSSYAGNSSLGDDNNILQRGCMDSMAEVQAERMGEAAVSVAATLWP